MKALLISVFLLLSTVTFAEDWSETVEKVQSGVVSIWTKAPTRSHNELRVGTGWLFNNTHTIITAKHVVDSLPHHYFVMFPNGERVDLKTLKRSPKDDVAVLVVASNPKRANYLFELNNSPQKKGIPIGVLGHPYDIYVYSAGSIFVPGNLTGFTNARATHYKDRIVMSNPLCPGYSGSPVFDLKGKVVGIAVGGDTRTNSLNFAVPSSTIIKELKDLL